MFKRIYIASFIFAITLALTAYINSSFLQNTVGTLYTGIVFGIASLMTLVLLEYIPLLLKKYGNYFLSITFILLSILSLATTTLPISKTVIGIVFVVYLTMNNMIAYSFDIFLEHSTKKSSVGSTRGLYLTINNIAWVISPLFAGILVTKEGFITLYQIVLAGMILIGILILFLFKKFKDDVYVRRSIFKTLSTLRHRRDVLRICISQFTLNFFFAIMVLFTPLYLYQNFDLSYKTMGLIFTIMLLPFVLIQYPLGRIADKRIGVKEILIAGFLVMSISTIWFSFYNGAQWYIFAIILFTTRVGASAVEVMNETFLFTKITDEEPDILSFFRAMTPLAFLIAPMLATISIGVIPYTSLFVCLGVLVLLGGSSILFLKDVR